MKFYFKKDQYQYKIIFKNRIKLQHLIFEFIEAELLVRSRKNTREVLLKKRKTNKKEFYLQFEAIHPIHHQCLLQFQVAKKRETSKIFSTNEK